MFAVLIDQLALDLYTRIFTKKEDQAVYALENGICAGGHMKMVFGTHSDRSNGRDTRSMRKLRKHSLIGRVRKASTAGTVSRTANASAFRF